MAENFTDLLAPPPPPPKAGFADILAAGFGAGPDRMGAYESGLNTGSQYRLRTAQTESALAEADKRRAEAMRQTQINDLVVKAQNDPNFAASMADLLTISNGAGDFGQGVLRMQEHGNRGVLSDPNASPMGQFLAGQGVQGEPLQRLYDVGGETVNMTTDPNATFQTPAQQARMDADVALAEDRRRPPAPGSAAATGGWNMVTVGGRRMRERTNPETGQYESEFVTDPQMLGRERMFAERVRVAGEAMADTLENISRMNVGASLGVFGVGASPGKSMMAATRDFLRNKATSEDVQMYTAALAGANRALGVLESAGLSPSGANQQSFEALAWREGDSEGTRLYKLAEMRQTVDNAMETALTNPGISPEMREQIRAIQQRVANAIPFSPTDILMMQRAPSNMTLGDLLKQRGLAGQPGAAAPATPAAAPTGGAGAGQWTKQVSPSTGRVRWINKATGETRTEAP